MARNSKLILAHNIKLDKSYKSVLCYTEQQMLNLVTSNAINSAIDYNYIRNTNTLEVSLPINTCMNANYLAYQNPDYSNKWFFAFIDRVEYISNGVTRINYTIDVWSTWYDYWVARACYVLRQHPNIDEAGSNLVPENLEHGEYILNSRKQSAFFREYYYMVVASISILGLDPITKFGSLIINGACYVCKNITGIMSTINYILSVTTPKQGEILDVYIVPKDLIGTPVTGDVLEITGNNSPVSPDEEILASKPTMLDNYTPYNKKLLTYPYCYLLVNNGVGNSNIWRFEDFTSSNIEVQYIGVPSTGTSIMCYPKNYKKGLTVEEALIGAKYPTLGWREDSYTNWLTQNAVNNQTTALVSGGSIALGTAVLGASLITGGAGALLGAGLIGSGVMGALEAGGEYYEHSKAPDTMKGLISAGDVLTSLNDLSYDFLYMSIKSTYAVKLDKFFTRFGYAQNEIQLPLFDNNSYREKYNFIQIARDQVTAIPRVINNLTINAEDLESINNIFRSGVTIWKQHDENFGNYLTTNPIINP